MTVIVDADRKLDDITAKEMYPILIHFFVCNPSSSYSLEAIHDFIMDRFKIDLEQTHSNQRSAFSYRLRNVLKRLTSLKIITEVMAKTAIGRARLKYSYNSSYRWTS